MAAPHRALTSSLRQTSKLATARTSTPRLFVPTTGSLCCQRAHLSTAATTRQAWRPTPLHGVSSPRATVARWYSSSEEQPPTRKWEFADVEKQIKLNAELEKSDKADGKVIFVDVREPHELHKTGKIPGAINIPITTAVQSFHISEEDFEDLYGFQRPNKDAELMFYCKAGIRAKGAAALAQHAGWSNVGDYPGSWNDWEVHQGPVEPVKKQG